MYAGRLSDLITVEMRVLTPNVYGQQVETWAPESVKLPCEPIRLTETNARFTIRYRGDLSTGNHRLIWDGSIWTSTSVIHDRRRTMTTIEADASDLAEVTHLQSTQREFIPELSVVRPPESD